MKRQIAQNIFTLLRNGHINIILPAGIQNAELASIFSEYRFFLSIRKSAIINHRATTAQ
jgi:hypothetical protein